MPKSKQKVRSRVISGIEYGDHVVRIATVVTGRGGKFTLKAATEVLVATGRPGVSEDLRANRRQALTEAISQHSTSLGDVVVGISRNEVISRLFSLPTVNPLELDDMLDFEVANHLPFDHREAEVSHRILEQVGNSESRVLVVAARRSELYRVLEDLDEVGVETLRLEVDAHGCGYALAAQSGSEPAFVFHLDYHKSLIGLLVNGQLRYTRVLSKGLQTPLLDGDCPDFSSPSQDWSQPQSQWWNDLVLKLKRTLAAFGHEEFGQHPQRVFLSGPGSELPGLAEHLSEALAIPATVQPLVESCPDGVSPQTFAVSIGLAVEEALLTQHLNLVPDEIYIKRERAHQRQFLVNVATLAVINILLLVGWVGHAFWHKHQVIGVLQAKIAQIRPQVRDVDEIEKKLNTIAANIDRENSAFLVLKDIFELTRDRIKIDQVVFQKKDSIKMNLNTFEDRDLDDYVKDLSMSQYLAGAIDRGRTQNVDLSRQSDRYDVPYFKRVSNLSANLRSKDQK